MEFSRRVAVVIACLAMTIGAARAENAYPVVDILSTGKNVVGETVAYPTTGPAKITASIVTIAPGAETVLHRHGVPLFGYVLEGDLTVDYGDKGKREFKPGQGFMEAMEVPHRGMNFGKTPVKILAVYMGAEGAANVILDKKH